MKRAEQLQNYTQIYYNMENGNAQGETYDYRDI